MKDWRLPTLAEAIQPLPSAMQCLTAVSGMGTGRTTAVLPPNWCARSLTCKIIKIKSEAVRKFVENYTQESIGVSQFASQNCSSKLIGKSNQASQPISIGQLNASRHLYFQPIKRVVCPWFLGSLRSGKHYLGMSLALRCFQRLSLPHMATQRCP